VYCCSAHPLHRAVLLCFAARLIRCMVLHRGCGLPGLHRHGCESCRIGRRGIGLHDGCILSLDGRGGLLSRCMSAAMTQQQITYRSGRNQ